MKGRPKIVAQLNAVLANELVSINQSFLHSRMFNDWGMGRMGKRVYKKSIRAMKQADKLIERILFLEGLPNLQDLGRLRIGQDTEDILKCEMALVSEVLAELRSGIAACEEHQDFVSRALLDDFLEDEEDFVDWLETQAGLVNDLGLKNYIQSQVEESSE